MREIGHYQIETEFSKLRLGLYLSLIDENKNTGMVWGIMYMAYCTVR